MTTKHTPGPWLARPEVCRNDHPDTSADVHGPQGQFVADCGCHEYATANAKLIAAAPTLADALERSLDQGDHADGCRWLDVPTASLQTDAQRDHARDNVCDCWRKSARAALRLAGRL